MESCVAGIGGLLRNRVDCEGLAGGSGSSGGGGSRCDVGSGEGGVDYFRDDDREVKMNSVRTGRARRGLGGDSSALRAASAALSAVQSSGLPDCSSP